MAKTKIHKETITAFLALLDQGMSKTAAAKELGHKKESIRKAAERLGIRLPERSLLKTRVLDRLDEIKTSDKPQHYWASEFGVSQPCIHKLFKELGLTATSKSGPRVDYAKKHDEYRQILAYISAHGGYVPDAIRSLELNTCAQDVRDFARSVGFDLSHFQFAFQEYGQWLTLPGPWVRKPPCNYEVPAVCRQCGEQYMLSLQNARVGKTTRCIKCCGTDRVDAQVVDVATGETFRSVMAWTSAIDKRNEYQALRIRLKNAGELCVDGKLYRLLER